MTERVCRPLTRARGRIKGSSFCRWQYGGLDRGLGASVESRHGVEPCFSIDGAHPVTGSTTSCPQHLGGDTATSVVCDQQVRHDELAPAE